MEATHKSAHSTAWSRNTLCRSLTQQLAAIKRAATKEILFPMIRFVVILIRSPIHIDHSRPPRRGLRKPSSTSLRGGTGSVNMGTVEFPQFDPQFPNLPVWKEKECKHID